MAWVVRAGEAKPQALISGYVRHRGVQSLFGISVQYSPARTIDELAQAGNFPNAQISFADETVLQAAISLLGSHFILVPSPGTGFHNTLAVIYDANGNMLQSLQNHPQVAVALSLAFQRMPNPHRRTTP